MSTQVTIDGSIYSIPTQNDNPPWGSGLTDAIVALADVSNSSVAAGDILTTTFSLGNNVTSPTVITGLSFDPASVTTAKISYGIKRSTSTQSYAESGNINVAYNAGTSIWSYSLDAAGDVGITFSVSGGQFSYISSNLSGSNHSATLTFSAKAFA